MICVLIYHFNFSFLLSNKIFCNQSWFIVYRGRTSYTAIVAFSSYKSTRLIIILFATIFKHLKN
eukprot:UN02380